VAIIKKEKPNSVLNGLDINTPKGQQSLEQERILLDALRKKLQADIIETDKGIDAVVDAIIHKDGIIRGILECKCRDLSEEDLRRYDTWLITYRKIKEAAKISKALRTPFYGAVYCLKDNRVALWKLTDDKGVWCFDFDVQDTRTRRTINGGSTVRANAFIPVSEAKWFTISN
jgi:hypothetical protein